MGDSGVEMKHYDERPGWRKALDRGAEYIKGKTKEYQESKKRESDVYHSAYAKAQDREIRLKAARDAREKYRPKPKKERGFGEFSLLGGGGFVPMGYSEPAKKRSTHKATHKVKHKTHHKRHTSPSKKQSFNQWGYKTY